MKIPRKITPDNIKDSVVQIVFNPLCPPELVIGRFENHLQDIFEFKGGTPPSKQVVRLPDGNELNFGQFQAGVFQGGFFLDKNESVKVTVNSNTLVFNSFKGYPGWEKMHSIISDALKIMFERGIIENIQRIGVRYISQFDDMEIFQKLKMSLSLNISNKNFSTTQLRSEYDEEAFKIILNLLNNFQRFENNVQRKFSMVDIDVIKFYKSPSTNVRDVTDSIDKAHFKQKSTFFSLLSEEFLKTLNPEY
ncbi:TIGR04255 family protein [Chryseolinea sp. H1M3-3]|uniref:TIGR04255 family protein n=1 Tax=Chryseolinea sp. H1M3-3 TaxID=3034144 RepID=UPI0023EA86B3|nr:TIGR04255 family protein [Chryseolinea sp. H1M3-3]